MVGVRLRVVGGSGRPVGGVGAGVEVTPPRHFAWVSARCCSQTDCSFENVFFFLFFCCATLTCLVSVWKSVLVVNVIINPCSERYSVGKGKEGGGVVLKGNFGFTVGVGVQNAVAERAHRSVAFM